MKHELNLRALLTIAALVALGAGSKLAYDAYQDPAAFSQSDDSSTLEHRSDSEDRFSDNPAHESKDLEDQQDSENRSDATAGCSACALHKADLKDLRKKIEEDARSGESGDRSEE